MILPMSDLHRQIVIDISPLLALCATCGDFTVLRQVYEAAITPYEVVNEISIREAILWMRVRGVWLADQVVAEAIRLAGE